MQRDVKVGLVLGVLLVSVVAVVFFRREDEGRDKFAKLLPAPDAVAGKARNMLGPAPSDPYPVAPEYVPESWQSSKTANSARTPTPQRNKATEPTAQIESMDQREPPPQSRSSRPSAILHPPEFEPQRTRATQEPASHRTRPAIGEAASRPGSATEYTIEEGDTLSGIASRFLGSASLWPTIYQQNPKVITDPEHIPVGQKIRIPQTARTEQRPGSLQVPVQQTPAPKSATQVRSVDTHVVRDGDTLIRIARERYGRDAMYLEILRANEDQLNSAGDLQPGMVLKLPQ